MKNAFSAARDKLIERYSIKDKKKIDAKSTNINVLLNRVKLDQKKRE